MKYLGVPYVWGGTTPAGFDCSGLVQYVFAQNGISLPRTTYDQIAVVQQVSLVALQPGDLVFWGGASPYHVASTSAMVSTSMHQRQARAFASRATARIHSRALAESLADARQACAICNKRLTFVIFSNRQWEQMFVLCSPY